MGFSIQVEDTPPQGKFYTIDIPGGNGVIDVTEALAGDVVFSNRRHVITMTHENPEVDFERVKTKVMNAWNGRRLKYRLSRDPGYTYDGRFSVTAFSDDFEPFPVITVTIDAQPYKSKGVQTFRVNAAGGIVVTLESGRMPVCPTFEFASETIVDANGCFARMQPGSYKINDLWLSEGTNEIYLNSYLGDGNVPMSTYADDLIGDYARNRISDLIWDGVRAGAVLISDWELDTIGMHAGERIVDAEFGVSAESERYAVYIDYDWRDL